MVGEIPQLGEWKNFSSGLMQWTEGHWWTISFEHRENEPFQFKFVVVNYDTREPIRWEEGRNRICDPEYIPDINESSCEKEPLDLIWNRFTVTFSIYLPLNDS